jgi:penicillin-binding protein 2
VERKHLIALFGVAFVSLAALEGRLFWLQVVRRSDYERYRSARRHVELIEPSRGRILDRHGEVLARDERAFAVEVVMADYAADPRVEGRLARLLNRPAEEIRAGVARAVERMERLASRRPSRERAAILRRESRTPYPLIGNVTFEQAYVIELNPELLPGLVVREERRRVYPQGAWVGALTHYVQAITREEHEALLRGREGLERLDETIGTDGVDALAARGAFLEWKVGRGGIEKQYDALLRGRPGLRLLEKRPREEALELELLAAEAGRDVRLTIDLRLQKAAMEALAPQRGAVVLMDLRDGSIRALAASPGFDPNAFVPPVDAARIRAILGEDGAMLHRAIAQPLVPGSVFKTVAALAALREAGADPARRIECDGIFEGRHRNMRCWIADHGYGHGAMALHDALEQSCNVYFYTLGSELGVPSMATWAIRMGYGSRTGIDLPGEREGLVPRRGVQDTAASFAIGQDRLLVTPLQVARAMAFIANGGRLVRPRITELQEPWVDRNPPLDEAALRAVRGGLAAAVEGPAGTAHNTRLREFKVAGKTGSAQAAQGKPTHAWFAGYFPHDDPRAVIAVVVEFAGHGGAVAAPIAETVIRAMYNAEGSKP